MQSQAQTQNTGGCRGGVEARESVFILPPINPRITKGAFMYEAALTQTFIEKWLK